MSIRWPLALALALAACGDDDAMELDAGLEDAGRDGGGTGDGGRDAATPVDAGPMDAGRDAGFEPDAGPEPRGTLGLVCDEGWCWDHPRPQGMHTSALDVGEDGTVWLSNSAGQIIRRDAAGWALPPEGSWAAGRTRGRPSDIARTATSLWVVGTTGVERWDGTSWQLEKVLPFGSYRMAARADDDVWVAGGDGVHHFDGTDWQLELTLSGLGCLWVDATHVVVGGESGVVRVHDGTAWSSYPSIPTGETVKGVLHAGGVIRAMTDRGVWRFASPGGFTQELSTAGFLQDLWGTGDEAWALATSAVFHFDGTRWNEEPLAENGPRFLAGRSRDAIWVAGDLGVVGHFDGARWIFEDTSLGHQPFEAIWGSSPTDAWAAVGRRLLRYDGADWSLALEAPASLNGGWSLTWDDAWVVGAGGFIAHWDGAEWTSEAPVSTDDLYAVWGASSDDVWAVGVAGALVHYDGRRWTDRSDQLPVGTPGLYGIWGAGPDDLWVVGEASTILHWDGSSWAPADLPFPADPTNHLRTVWGSGPGDLWVGGTQPVLLRYDGAAWSSQSLPHAVRDIAGTGPDDVVLVHDSLIRRWDGVTFEETTPLPASQLRRAFTPAPETTLLTLFQGIVRAEEP